MISLRKTQLTSEAVRRGIHSFLANHIVTPNNVLSLGVSLIIIVMAGKSDVPYTGSPISPKDLLQQGMLY